MAGPVKGEWGGEEIVLNDAATETTLLAILAAINGMGGGGSGGGSGSGNTEAGDALLDLANNSDDLSGSFDDLTDEVDETTSALDKLSAGIGNAFSSIGGLAEEFLVGGDRLSDFSKHITGAISEFPLIGPAVGGIAQLFVSVIDDQIDTFRELSGVGVDFGGSLIETKNAAIDAGLSLDTYKSVIMASSEQLSLLGGNAEKGARVFNAVSGTIQRELGPQFAALGMTMEQTAEYTADYLNFQTRLGRAQRMNNDQLAAGAGAYIMQLDKLSKVTGKQRDQIAKEMQEQAMDKRIKAMFAGMDGAQSAQLSGMLSLIEGASPDIADATKEMMATGGVPVSDFAKSMQRLNPRLGEMAAGLMDGTVSQEQYLAEVRKTGDMMDNMSEAQRRQAGILSALGNSALDANLAFIGLSNLGEGMEEAVQAQQAAADRGSKGLLAFENRLTQARNVLFGALIESGVFQTLETAFGDIVSSITSGNGFNTVIESATGIAQSLAETFTNIVEEIKANGIWPTIQKYTTEAFANLKTMVKEALFGRGPMTDEEKAKKESEIESKKARVNETLERIKVQIEGNKEYQKLLKAKAEGKGLTEAETKALETHEKRLQATSQEYQALLKARAEGKELTEAETAALKTHEDRLQTNLDVAKNRLTEVKNKQDELNSSDGSKEGFFGSIPWGKIALGIGVATAAITGIGMAVSALAPGLAIASPGLLALGAAMAGVGVAGAGVSMLIDSITGSIEKIAIDLEKFQDLDPSKLLDVGKSVKPLADVLVDLAKGGIVASFISDGALEGLANGLKSFQSINAENMLKLGPALTSLKIGMEAFTGGGLLDSVGKSFTSFVQGATGSGTGAFDPLVEGLEKFQSIDGENIAKLGPALTKLKIGMEAFTGEGLLESAQKSVVAFFQSMTGAGVQAFDPLVQGLKKFDEVNTVKLTAIGIALDSMMNFDFLKIIDITDGLELLRVYANDMPEDAFSSLVYNLSLFSGLDTTNFNDVATLLGSIAELKFVDLLKEITEFQTRFSTFRFESYAFEEFKTQLDTDEIEISSKYEKISSRMDRRFEKMSQQMSTARFESSMFDGLKTQLDADEVDISSRYDKISNRINGRYEEMSQQMSTASFESSMFDGLKTQLDTDEVDISSRYEKISSRMDRRFEKMSQQMSTASFESSMFDGLKTQLDTDEIEISSRYEKISSRMDSSFEKMKKLGGTSIVTSQVSSQTAVTTSMQLDTETMASSYDNVIDLQTKFADAQNSIEFQDIKLDTDNIINYNRALMELVETTRQLTEEMSKNKEIENKTGIQTSSMTSTSSSESKQNSLEQLNTTMTQVLNVLVENNKINTRSYQVQKKNTDAMW